MVTRSINETSQQATFASAIRRAAAGDLRIPCKWLATIGLGVAALMGNTLHAQSGLPQPIRNQGFARPIPDTDGGLRTVQAYERIGKQFMPSQPTGRTTLQRQGTTPWLERFMRPRSGGNEGRPTANTPRQPVPNQPPLRNAESQDRSTPQAVATKPLPARNTKRNFSGVGPSSTGQPKGYPPAQRPLPAYAQPSASKEYQTGSRFDSQQRTGGGTTQRAGIATNSSRLPDSSSAGDSGRSSAGSIGIGSLPGFQPTQTVDTRASSRTTKPQGSSSSKPLAERTSRTQRVADASTRTTTTTAKTQADPSNNTPPKVARVPLPAKNNSSVAKNASNGASKPRPQSPPKKETASAANQKPSVARTAPAKPAARQTMTANLNKPAKVGSQATGQQQSVSVPTQLVNTPKSESAARSEAHSPPPALYMTTEYARQRTRQESPSASTARTESAPRDATKAGRPEASEASSPNATATTATPKIDLPLPQLPSVAAKQPAGAAASQESDTSTLALPSLPTPAESKAADAKPALATPTLPQVSQGPVARKMPPVRTQAIPPQNTASQIAAPTTNSQRMEPAVQPGNQQVSASRSMPAGTLTTGMAARFDDPSFGYSQTPGPNERLRMQSPHIRVTLNGPSSVAVGTVGDYEVVVVNQDQIELNGLLLRLEVPQGVAVQPVKPESGEVEIERTPDGATMMTWGIERLDRGDVVRAPIKMVANASSDFAIGLEWTLVPITGLTNVHVVSPQLQLAIDGKSDVLYGESNIYRLRLKNVGEATAKSVQVKVQAEEYGASATEIGDIAPGAEELLEVELEFEQSGPIELSATAVAKNKVSTVANQKVMVRQPVLTAELAAPRTVYHGNDVAYAVRIRNSGDAASREEVAYLKLPKAARPVALPYGAEHNGSALAWKVQPLAVGEERVYQFQIALPAEGDNQVVFECGNQLGSAVRTDAHTLVQAIADLKLIVSDPVAPAPLGTEVVYELNLTNRGSKAAHNVSVVAQFSKGIEPTRSSGHSYRVVPGQVFFDPISTVGPGESVKLMIYAVAEDAGMHRFRAEVRSSDEDIRLVQEESTRYLEASSTRVAAPPASSPLR